MPTTLQFEMSSSSDFLKRNDKGIKVLTYLLCSVCVCVCVCVCVKLGLSYGVLRGILET